MDEEADDKRLKNLLRITQLVTSGAGLLVKKWESTSFLVDQKQHCSFMIMAQVKGDKTFHLSFRRDILISVPKD